MCHDECSIALLSSHNRGHVLVFSNKNPILFEFSLLRFCLNVHTFADNSPEKDVIIEKATGLKNIEQNRILHVTDANGTKYACHLPPKGSLTLNDESKSCSNIDSDIDQEGVCKEEALLHSNPSDSDKEGHIESPEEILDSLGDWCAYKLDGWWTYEVCYKKRIRQYHSEENEITQQFNLGNYVAEDTDMTKVRIETGVTGKEMRYALQSYRHGDACDLTGQKRTTDVKYTCSASSESPTIVDIQETSSCAYTATVAISELCQHPDFVEVQSPPVLINCYIISPREDSKSIQNKQS